MYRVLRSEIHVYNILSPHKIPEMGSILIPILRLRKIRTQEIR